ncbi:MAG: lysine--tRNA ligase [Patescibacteria group bacterium]|nr:lysine--tRNA ligase [Patescibacteria group bacterium]MDE2116953.1 lysine--tRNA ligase [Patescibacteria group bacterium]
MATVDEIRKARLAKIELLKKAGMDPYPAKVPRDMSLGDIRARFASLAPDKPISIAGRIMAIRGQGAIFFVVLDDGEGRFQAVFKKDALAPAAFKLFGDAADIGDFVSVTGAPFTTQKGEPSLLASAWTMASKSLLPLPEKWHGLQDEEEKLRKRYLDMIMTPETRELFAKKARFWEVTRSFLKSRGFLEVETPTLEVTTGGAEARPFKTHHNDYDIDVFLRISVGELWQKRLMAAGFTKTFEIGRAYRNEGSSPEHLQEFTNMEFYWAYADYRDGMKLVQELYRTIAREVFGTTKFTTRGHTFDFADEWPEIRYADEIKKQTGVDIVAATDADIKSKLAELGVKYEGANRERLLDTLWKYCRKHIAGPAFLVEMPALVVPLAKKVPGKDAVQIFKPIIGGSEVGNGYSELNDPIDQRERFELQQKLIDSGDEEAMMADYEFVDMLEHGMPPTCGFGFGERLFAFLVDRPLRETQLFPLVRPKKDAKKEEGKKTTKSSPGAAPRSAPKKRK